MKRLTFTSFIAILAFTIIFSSCSKLSNDTVTVRMMNISEEDFTDLTVKGTEIGTLSAGSSTDYFKFDSFSKTNENLLEFVSAKVDDTWHSNNTGLHMCGCEECQTYNRDAINNNKVRSGAYTLEIDVNVRKEGSYTFNELVANLKRD